MVLLSNSALASVTLFALAASTTATDGADLVAAAAAAGAGGGVHVNHPVATAVSDADSLVADTPSMLFFSMGDWGGNSDGSPTTPGELANGNGMQSYSTTVGVAPSFVMAVGDNFYGSGIHGTDHSIRFNETFEQAFPQRALQVPWYVIAGNHDHLGNVSAQIAYTEDSDRWTYPSMWYTWNRTTTDGVTTQVVYLDTVVIAGQSYADEEGNFHYGEPHPAQSMMQTQLEWLEDTLSKSTADYLWVSGHYPMYSQCEHGPTLALQTNVLPLMQKYNASGFIAGHDHCSGHFEAHSMAFVLAGAGKECCYSPKNLNNKLNPGAPLFRMDGDQKHDAIGGFASYSVSATDTTIRYHKQDGSVLYTASAVSPRTTLKKAL